MDNKAIMDQLTEIFQDVFDDDTLKINDDTTAEDIEEWDSLMQIRIIAAIEKQFCIKFNFTELSTMNSVGAMVKVIVNKMTS